MLAKINSFRGTFLVFVLALLLTGCTPAGPRALLRGKKCLDRGDVAGAVTQFKRATTLLATNASAWNYLGVALHRSGQPDEAAAAYQTALRLDRDLAEAHYNLGSLWLEQNRPDLAKGELTAYTLRRPNDVNGWLKLGFAQLRSGEAALAERSFSTVLSLKSEEAQAYNGLGLARLQGGRSREAAQFFAAAVQARPDFAAALQNLALVNLQYLHDNKAALASFEAYLALVPRPANYNEVKSLAASLAQSDASATVMAPAVIVKTSPPPPEAKAQKPVTPPPSRPAPPVERTIERTAERTAERTEPEEAYSTHGESRTPVTAPSHTFTAAQVPTQTVHLPPEPGIVVSSKTSAAPKTNRPIRTARPTTVAMSRPAAASVPPAGTTNGLVPGEQPLQAPLPDEEQPRPGFWHRLFKGDRPSSSTSSAKRYREETETTEATDTNAPAPETEVASAPASTPSPTPTVASAPQPATADEMAGTKPEEKPAEPKPPPVNTARYTYTAPAKPAPGDRQSAEGGFTKARMAEQDENWVDAEQWYQMAADTDPSWFEAQYNTGVIAHRLHNFSVALPRYELALAIQPDSVDARYNFALALKAAGYPLDAAEQLKKILAADPDETRAQLALANLYAQSLHDPAQARLHYLRVLDLQPDNPQAADIRFWLSANAEKNKSE